MNMDLSDTKSGSQKVFTRRAVLIAGLQTTILAFMGGRLAMLQIAEGKKYKTLSDKNRIHTKIIAPLRGDVVDRYGAPLAVNQQNFRVLMTPEQTVDMRKTLERLKTIINLEDRHIDKALKAASRVKKFVPVEVSDDLTWEDVAKIEVRLPELSGLKIDVDERRTYPIGEASAHLVGYVGSVNQDNVPDDPIFSLPGLKIGKTGIERSFDESLRGKAGSANVEVNVTGREVRELERQAPQDGARIVLSVDGELQQFTQTRLGKERSASAVIMDALDGGVYAIASSPGFDPNLFTKPLRADTWEQMLANPGHPLTNKSVSGRYPPGSTFKMITALAALEAGVVDARTRVKCPGHYEYGSDKFHCWKVRGHGSVNIVDALAQSCDVYFYKLATEVGIDKIAQMARRFGLGATYGFDLKEEHKGLIPDKDWKLGYFGKSWQPGETIVASIGQGYTLTTPLQLAVMTARLVNGGYAVQPWLHQDPVHMQTQNLRGTHMGISKYHLSLMKKGMDAVVNSPKGTALDAMIKTPGLEFGGKTGTAQVKRITMAQRMAGVQNKNLAWKYRHHALFVGYAPIHKPRYICATVIEHGGSGSSAAAPLARDLLLEVQKRKPGDKGIYASMNSANPGKNKT